MKIPINEAARRLHLHPCELVLELAQIATSFDDLHPEVEEGFVETLKQMRPERFFKSPRDARTPEAEIFRHRLYVSPTMQSVLFLLLSTKDIGAQIKFHRSP